MGPVRFSGNSLTTFRDHLSDWTDRFEPQDGLSLGSGPLLGRDYHGEWDSCGGGGSTEFTSSAVLHRHLHPLVSQLQLPNYLKHAARAWFRLSRNVGQELPLLAAKCPRTVQFTKKLQFCLSTQPWHTEGTDVYLLHSLFTSPLDAGGHRPLYPREAVWDPEPVWTVWSEISVPLLGFGPPPPDGPAQKQSESGQ